MMNYKHNTHCDAASTRNVMSIIQGTHFGLGLIFKVQLYALYTDITAPWEEVKEE